MTIAIEKTDYVILTENFSPFKIIRNKFFTTIQILDILSTALIKNTKNS